MIAPLTSIILAGLFGGVVRALVGILKRVRSKKFKEFDPFYFSWTVALSGIVGVFAALLLSQDYKISMLAGYAGIDLIESMIKIQQKKP